LGPARPLWQPPLPARYSEIEVIRLAELADQRVAVFREVLLDFQAIRVIIREILIYIV
jgi:hypothetical protein